MSLLASIILERRRRKAVEAELIQLRAQFAELTSIKASEALLSGLSWLSRPLKEIQVMPVDQQDLARQVIDVSPYLVYVENEVGECVLSNKRYAQLLSQWAPVEEGKDAEAGPAHTSGDGRVIDMTTAFEQSYRLLDGQTHWYHTTQSPLIRNDGSRYLVTYSSDITKLKRAYQLVEESGRAKQVLLANMSHEFRTPLHGVMGLADLLKKGSLSAEQVDYVEMIQYSTEHLLMVVDDVLNFTKTESGKINLECIPFDLLKTVQQAARSLAFKTAEKGLHLSVEESITLLPLFQGDPYRLHQILVNLIGNAIKFTRQGSIKIIIESGREIGPIVPVTFSITDTGIGISTDNLDHIFTSFQQADNSIPRQYGGTGLGLAICKNLIELQGGRIGVRSALNQGSCFYFTIPYAVSEQQLVNNRIDALPTSQLQGIHVLLVEDDAISQLLAVTILGQWQVEVELAQNGEKALARALQRRYDVILMDIQMPGLDGIEATAQLRREGGPNHHTPIIAVTADVIRINADTCPTLGFTDFLLKPYTEAALHQMLARFSLRRMSMVEDVNSHMAPSYSPAPTDARLHYDFLTLGNLGTNTEFTRKLLEMFIDRVPGQVQALQEAITQEYWSVAGSEAHKLKTAFATLNIQPVTENLTKLETLAEQQGPVSEISALMMLIAQDAQMYMDRFLRDSALLLGIFLYLHAS